MSESDHGGLEDSEMDFNDAYNDNVYNGGK